MLVDGLAQQIGAGIHIGTTSRTLAIVHTRRGRTWLTVHRPRPVSTDIVRFEGHVCHGEECCGFQWVA